MVGTGIGGWRDFIGNRCQGFLEEIRAAADGGSVVETQNPAPLVAIFESTSKLDGWLEDAAAIERRSAAKVVCRFQEPDIAESEAIDTFGFPERGIGEMHKLQGRTGSEVGSEASFNGSCMNHGAVAELSGEQTSSLLHQARDVAIDSGNRLVQAQQIAAAEIMES